MRGATAWMAAGAAQPSGHSPLIPVHLYMVVGGYQRGGGRVPTWWWADTNVVVGGYQRQR